MERLSRGRGDSPGVINDLKSQSLGHSNQVEGELKRELFLGGRERKYIF